MRFMRERDLWSLLLFGFGIDYLFYCLVFGWGLICDQGVQDLIHSVKNIFKNKLD